MHDTNTSVTLSLTYTPIRLRGLRRWFLLGLVSCSPFSYQVYKINPEPRKKKKKKGVGKSGPICHFQPIFSWVGEFVGFIIIILFTCFSTQHNLIKNANALNKSMNQSIHQPFVSSSPFVSYTAAAVCFNHTSRLTYMVVNSTISVDNAVLL